jgi:hypothetical protein
LNAGLLALTLLTSATALPAATFFFAGALGADGDLARFQLSLATDGPIAVRTLSYGGWSAPLLPPGGFAPGLALYDLPAGTLQIADFLGGTAIGNACSNGAQQDPVTGFCQDATLSFQALAGSYQLILFAQGNNAPGQLTDPFPLAPGTSFAPGPFADPGDPTGATLRLGNWAIEVTLDGTVTSDIPEPASAGLAAAGLGMVLWLRRRVVR